MPRLPASRLERYTVEVVDRALAVLELLSEANEPLSLGNISSRLGLVKSSGFRLLCTLERRGYVERVEGDGRYQLGAKWLQLNRALPGHRPLSEAALPHMRLLLEAFGETVNLGVLRDGKVFYVEILESPHSFRMSARVGSQSPVHSTAIGKAFAAYLSEEEVESIIRTRGLPWLTPRTITTPAAWKRELTKTRTRGYAEDNGETEPEASCIGAPIFGQDGRALGAISISGPTSRIQAIKPRAIRALARACKTISRSLGHRIPVAARGKVMTAASDRTGMSGRRS